MTINTSEPLFDREEALGRIGGNDDLLKTLITMYIDDYSNAFEKIITLFETNKKEDALRELHTLKSVSGNLALTNLYQQVISAERQLKELGYSEDKKESLLELQKLNNLTISEMKKEVGS